MRLALVLSFGAVGVGCGPHWIVLRQAVPDPFVNQRQFFIEPVHSENVAVGDKPEAMYLAEKTPEPQISWRTDKLEMIAHYADALMDDT